MQGSSRPDRKLVDAASLCSHLVKQGSVYAFLAEHRQKLFPDDMFADLFPSDRGRPSVPADVIATVMVLQALEGLSDREACRQLETNISWKVACGLGIADEAFHPTVLVLWRNKLRASERPERMRPVAFAPGWFNYADHFNDPTYEKVRFFKDESDVVHLQGLATFPVGYWTTPVDADGSQLFVLPPRYRPSHRLVVVAAGNCQVGSTDVDGKCRVDILPDGRVTLNDTLPSVLSLSSITFRVP